MANIVDCDETRLSVPSDMSEQFAEFFLTEYWDYYNLKAISKFVADNSHEISSLIFSEKLEKKKIVVCCSAGCNCGQRFKVYIR